MKEFDCDNCEEKLIKNLGEFLKNPDVKPKIEFEVVKNASTTCYSIICWVNAIHDFYYVNKEVKPKKIKAKQAEDRKNVLLA